MIFYPNLKPTEPLPCGCVNNHMWWTVGALPGILMETRFDDPDGRWCPQCGEPDRYCVGEFGLTRRDPNTISISYALVVDDGGSVYVDRRLRGASSQEN